MKYVITTLFTALLALPAFAGEIDLSQTEKDIQLIRTNLQPNASNRTLSSVDVLMCKTVEDLGWLLSQGEPDHSTKEEAQALWDKLATILNNAHTEVKKVPSDDDQQALIRAQIDKKGMALNYFYQHELRSNPMLGGRIVVELNFMPTGYLEDIEIKSADEGLERLAIRILPLLRTVRIKPQEASQKIEYKLSFSRARSKPYSS